MDWKLFVTTFATVFMAELGDKTQLATLTFASSSQSKWAVFIGSALALVLTSAIAVLVGEAASKLIPPNVLKRIAAGAFVVIGVWMFWKG
ncbi:MAG: TMEM165/GDT1 family protein [Myxococcaceae bacterium]|nr:TMEM165/GDT1 family protein [Myxococcaceae bacterium]